MKRLVAVTLALGALCSTSLALAQAAPEPTPASPSPPPTTDTAPAATEPAPAVAPAPAPEPAPAVAPAPAPAPAPVAAPPPFAPPPTLDRAPEQAAHVREHRGFYFSLNAGPAYFSATSSFGAGQSRSFSGPSTMLSGAIGGTLSKTPIILGGTIGSQWVHGLSGTDENGNALDLGGTSFSMLSAGFLIDGYFQREGGWHVLGIVGLSNMSVDRPNGEYDDDPTGFFLTAGVGYDWWVANDIALGLLAKLAYHGMEVTESPSTPADVSVFSPGLALTFSVN